MRIIGGWQLIAGHRHVVSVCTDADLWKYWGLIRFSSAKVTVIEGVGVWVPEEGGYPLPSLQMGTRIEESCRFPVGSGAKPQRLKVILFCTVVQ